MKLIWVNFFYVLPTVGITYLIVAEYLSRKGLNFGRAKKIAYFLAINLIVDLTHFFFIRGPLFSSYEILLIVLLTIALTFFLLRNSREN